MLNNSPKKKLKIYYLRNQGIELITSCKLIRPTLDHESRSKNLGVMGNLSTLWLIAWAQVIIKYFLFGVNEFMCKAIEAKR
jgi:hypothetical protein